MKARLPYVSILFIAGLVFIGGWLYWYTEVRRIAANGLKVTGTAISLNYEDEARIRCVIQYTDGAGHIYTLKNRSSFTDSRYTPGQPVPVIYSYRDPSQAFIDTPAEWHFYDAALMGLVLIGSGLFILTYKLPKKD